MRKLLLGTACCLLAGPLQAQTINILMESVPADVQCSGRTAT